MCYGAWSWQQDEVGRSIHCGEVGLRLLDRFQGRVPNSLRVMVQAWYYDTLAHWSRPFAEILPLSLDNYRLGISTGALEYSGYSLWQYYSLRFFSGQLLQQLIKDIANTIQSSIEQRRECHAMLLHHLYRMVCRFADEEMQSFFFHGHMCDADDVLESLRESSAHLWICEIDVQELICSFHERKWAECWEACNRALAAKSCGSGLWVKFELNFFHSLLLLATALSPASDKGDNQVGEQEMNVETIVAGSCAELDMSSRDRNASVVGTNSPSATSSSHDAICNSVAASTGDSSASASSSRLQSVITQVECNQSRLGKWAHYQPFNFLSRYKLVQAEIRRVQIHGLGQHQFVLEAMKLYDQAILAAKQQKCLQLEACQNTHILHSATIFIFIYVYIDRKLSSVLWGFDALLTCLICAHSAIMCGGILLICDMI